MLGARALRELNGYATGNEGAKIAALEDILLVSEGLVHNGVEGAGDVRRAHAKFCRCVAEPKAGNGRHDNMERRRGRRGRMCERLDHFADLEKAAWPAMREEEWDGVLALGDLVHVVDSYGAITFDLDGDFEVAELSVDCIL